MGTSTHTNKFHFLSRLLPYLENTLDTGRCFWFATENPTLNLLSRKQRTIFQCPNHCGLWPQWLGRYFLMMPTQHHTHNPLHTAAHFQLPSQKSCAAAHKEEPNSSCSPRRPQRGFAIAKYLNTPLCPNNMDPLWGFGVISLQTAITPCPIWLFSGR